MLVFEDRGKPEFPEKNLSEQSREPTNLTHIWRRVRESHPDTLVEGERSHHCANPGPPHCPYFRGNLPHVIRVNPSHGPR